MIIYPAIDLIDGKCVRLFQGDYDKKTVYQAEPLDVAKGYNDNGAEWLHLVDLDGAKNPARRQLNLISRLIDQSGLKIQTGGGIRSREDVKALLDIGVNRVVIGSLAVKKPQAVQEIMQEFGVERITLAMDVQPVGDDFKVAISGWQDTSSLSLVELIKSFQDFSLLHLLCTDISRDGTMNGCNVDLYTNIKSNFPSLQLQASGGVKSTQDIQNLKNIAAGIVIGKALYDGAFTLKEALSC